MTYILSELYVIVSYAFFPLPLMALFGLVTIVFLILGYGILLRAAPMLSLI